ncbi:MAG: aminotransferase class IV [Anaerolineae bacterium]|nr:aminotransferase class IV [Anaerolineae bacterium]MDW8173426.1 aminotransferase class IV [Anaerolineae bacterium]
MPCLIAYLTPDGLVDADVTADSLADAARHEPREGVYTITNTYHTTQVVKLDAHLDRLEQSARLAHIPLALDRPRLRAALRQLIERAAWGDVRFRISVPAATPQKLILSIEPFKPLDPALLERGARAITASNAARHDPLVKSSDWLHERQRLQDAMPPGIYDTFLCDADDHILEGLASNFYAILDGELRTAGSGVLEGISRQIVLEVAPALLPVRLEAIRRADLPRCEEAFLSSSSRGPVPLVEIDGQAIGTGQVGAMTRRLRAAYLDWVAAHLEEL